MGKYLFQNLRIVCLDEYHSIYQRLQAEAFSHIGILILGAALGQIDLPDDARIRTRPWEQDLLSEEHFK